jgi:hypothetical protein
MKQASTALVVTLVTGLSIAGPAQARGVDTGEAPRAGHGHPPASSPHRRSPGHGDAGFQRYVDGRQAAQRQRIQEGRRSGALNHKETRRLWEEQRRIAKPERRSRTDGNFSRGERRVLHQSLDNASRHIYRREHHERARIRHPGRRLPTHGQALGLWDDGIGFFWYNWDPWGPSRSAHRHGHWD